MFTSDADNKEVFALAGTLVVWVIVQVPECHEAMIVYSSRLFVALLFHVVITTHLTTPEEGVNYWRARQEEHRLPSDSNRSQSSSVHATVVSTSAPSVTWALLCTQMFRKFVPIKHRRTNITATESPTEPDSRLIELQAEPDVSTDLAEQSENCDAGANDDRAIADMPMTEDVPITNTNTADTQGIAETETRPDLAGRSEDSDTTVNDDEAKQTRRQ
ncbi:hypothetical protein DUI87_04142 [Hirundo rustica rustica]|uniref:Uncharacterized protein n=1 Tax=Hirundo rustica rustica TaxID=333673 RepID=A0A3M0L5J9_HIRRU|nr:hypothetical protein DUI87_04142 [Hirundo rustica rustica]